jgi:hypothetical protein
VVDGHGWHASWQVAGFGLRFERGVLLQHTHCGHSWKGSVLGAGTKGSGVVGRHACMW